MEKLDKMYIPAGAVIHFEGIPLQLPETTAVLGIERNFEINHDTREIRRSIMQVEAKKRAKG